MTTDEKSTRMNWFIKADYRTALNGLQVRFRQVPNNPIPLLHYQDV
jgi:hypothetical protein